jgi:cytochrome c biogenesis factor
VINKKTNNLSRYLFFPAITWSLFLVLLITAIIKQNSGSVDINFEFLSYYAVIICLVLVVLVLFGLVKNKKLKQPLLLINASISIAIIVILIAMGIIINRPNTSKYACNDYVRCLFVPPSNKSIVVYCIPRNNNR